MTFLTKLAVTDRAWSLEFTEAQREECRAWMRDCGADPNVTFAVEVSGEGEFIAHEMPTSELGCIYRDEHLDVVTEPVQYPCRVPPPWWSFPEVPA